MTRVTPSDRLRRVVGRFNRHTYITAHAHGARSCHVRLSEVDTAHVVASGEDTVEITFRTDTETARRLLEAYDTNPAIVKAVF